MFIAHDRGTEDLKRCKYCDDWVPSKARVCPQCHAILVEDLAERPWEDSGETQVHPDRVAGALAAIASLVCYMTLWVVGGAAGFILPPVVGGIAGAVYVGSRRSQNERLSRWGQDASLPVLVGVLCKIIVQLGVVPNEAVFLGQLAIALGGGIAFGVLRRQLFLSRLFSNLVVKVIAVPVVAVLVIYVALVGVWLIAAGSLIPVELVTPSTVPEGWTATASLDLAGKRLSYEKGTASVEIAAAVVGPMTEEEARDTAQNIADALLAGITLTGGGTSHVVDRSDTIMPDGRHRYTHHHRIEHRGATSFPRVELLDQYFYCEDLEANVFAQALIKDEPFEKLIGEAWRMMESLHC